jgi:hypothetical protein
MMNNNIENDTNINFWKKYRVFIIIFISIIVCILIFYIGKNFFAKKSNKYNTDGNRGDANDDKNVIDHDIREGEEEGDHDIGEIEENWNDEQLTNCQGGNICYAADGSNKICETGYKCQNGDCILCEDNCANFKELKTCKDTVKSMNNDSALYSCCISRCKEEGGSGCCLWPGCVACGFDKDGNINPQNIYLLFLNDPENMAKFMVASAKTSGHLDTWSPGTYPMFSNEVAHDWLVDPSKKGLKSISALTKDNAILGGNKPDQTYKVYATNALDNPDDVNGKFKIPNKGGKESLNSNLCGSMKWNSPNSFLCGTFDGFGIWTWEKFVEFLIHFSSLTGIQELGVYDAQFFMPHWMNAPTIDPTNKKYKVKASPGILSKETSLGGNDFGKKEWELKLHLYLGAWPNLSNEKSNDGLWQDVIYFCKTQPMIKYIYMDIDSSGISVDRNLIVQSKSYLTARKIAYNANQLLEQVSDDFVLGAVITTNPKDGFLIPIELDEEEKMKYALEESGGQIGDYSEWKSPPSRDGMVELHPAASVCKGIEYGKPSNYDGCPNSIQNAVYLMKQANDILKNTYNKKTLFTRFIQDGENNGSATARYDIWYNSIEKYIIPQGIKKADIKIGQAFSASTNTSDLFSPFETHNTFPKSSMLALPELYWYTDLMKNGYGKFDETNQNMNEMKQALINGGLTEKLAKELIIYGVGCEGCDHNHLGAARQASKVSHLIDGISETSNGHPNSIYQFPGSGWPLGIGMPVVGTCGLLDKCLIPGCQKCEGQYCTVCKEGTIDLSGKGPCVTPTNICPKKCDKGCDTSKEKCINDCCVSNGVMQPEKEKPKCELDFPCTNDDDCKTYNEEKCNSAYSQYYCKSNNVCHFKL